MIEINLEKERKVIIKPEVKKVEIVNKIENKIVATTKFTKVITDSLVNMLKIVVTPEVKDAIIANENSMSSIMEDLLEQQLHTAREFKGIKRDENDVSYLDKSILKLVMYRNYLHNKSKK
jgi:N-acetylglutamate synthase-like GNAT family acetyltransferase